ncbi:hypothetical protein IU474_20815 [Nocardia otitidiscaviarum]|uniref:hypothetical protein n=1 Tax=Nocardia otitidiscaviarum TaxID=1823 RepID=UPI001895D277|nr:hypothetical protein [Nocardia otitidiscaviarum]MBF6239495.1 hypothetical protein [Nocardia otitidiscaviarum]
MKRAVGWTLLVLFAWPIALIVWIAKYPNQAKCVWNTIRDFVRKHPRGCAVGGVIFGAIGIPAGISEADAGMIIFYAGIMVACAVWLLIQRKRAHRAAAAAIAARPDAQHRAYLEGDDYGVYGTRDMPQL